MKVEKPAFDALDAPRTRVGESPLWSVAEQALWWVDIEGLTTYRHDPASGRTQRWPTAERPACIALHAEGGLIAGMESAVFRLRPQPDGTLVGKEIAPARHPRDGMRFNDGRCDRRGRFWLSSMVRDMALAAPDGSLYRVDARGLSAPLVPGLVTGNGLAFSPAGDVLYLSDSHPSVQRVWAFDLADDGTPGNRREFIDMNAHPGRPDGAAVDTDGAYWICANDAGLVHRFTPDGRLDRSIEVPVAKPAMCAFGGPDLKTLFVTSIRPASPPAGQEQLAGALFATRPGAQGLAESPFKP